MLSIGAPLRKWTLFLLVACSIPTSAATQPANDAHATESGATAHQSVTTHHGTAVSSLPAPAPSTESESTRTYSGDETTCPFRTINYITHTLPQQCAKTSWSAHAQAAAANGTAAEAAATPDLHAFVPGAIGRAEGVPGENRTASSEAEIELETDSPFDNANFLSFEEWKNRNLAQVGQSPENVGQGRAAASNQATRRQPVNVNALDSLGDETEIEIDFSGFGTPAEGENVASNIHRETQGPGATKATDGEGKVAPSSWALSKDAGKTCKERFNYASFDCAATVLKTNKQAKSSSSILVENKDSYMLNECAADNKFLIVELCDDILVDTIVLANYEFFSSMFRHFRVSVSDRYPVKMERWRTLGTFEARNTRDIQPFLITAPQIWARYLRVEFLTQFGNEFYCPLSLLRVHGTTMMEQFRREEEEARGVDEDDGDLEAEAEVVNPAEDSGPLPPDQIPVLPVKEDENHETIPHESTSQSAASSKDADQRHIEQRSGAAESSTTSTAKTTISGQSSDVAPSNKFSNSSSTSPPPFMISLTKNGAANATSVINSKTPEAPVSAEIADISPQTQSSISKASNYVPSVVSRNDNIVSPVANATTSVSSSSPPVKTSGNGTVGSSQVHVQSPSRASHTQPSPPVPSTQESFFKSIHKRLLYLEANSTLSLQYIEEQSRILRDAFVKVEKRQLAKTEKFLDHLNSTVMHELKSYRTMYEQLWQSTIIELENMKERQRSEVGEIGTRLSLMADELVWQKRMAVVQSTLLLLCLGLVLFVRSGTLGSAADVPIVQQLGSKYTSFFESSPPRSPEPSGIVRRRRTFRNMWRSDTSVGLSDHPSDGPHALSDAETDGAKSPEILIEYNPPTPDSPNTPNALGTRHRLTERHINSPDTSPLDEYEQDTAHDHATLSPDEQAQRIQVLETQSGPATPNGTRDIRPSWEEVDRAIDQLKAEENGQSSPRKQTRNDRDRKKKRISPLRRAYSSYDGCTADDSPADNSGDGLFID